MHSRPRPCRPISFRSPRDGPRGRSRFRPDPPTKPRASREPAVFDRAQEGGEEGSPVVRMVSENAKWRHSSFSLLWYELWYDFCKPLVLLEYWRRGRDSNPRYAMNVHTLSRRAPSTTRTPLPGTGRVCEASRSRNRPVVEPGAPAGRPAPRLRDSSEHLARRAIEWYRSAPRRDYPGLAWPGLAWLGLVWPPAPTVS